MTKPITILYADDDPDDRMLVGEALAEAKLANDLRFVEDGVELIEYLTRTGAYEDPETSPRPGLILLDLNMPRMDGREALAKIRANSELRGIPVVILTTSHAETDIVSSYDLGVNSYITKPVRFDDMVQVLSVIGRYWFQIVELPPEQE